MRGKTARNKTKKFVAQQIKEIATEQDMHCFSYEEDDSGQYAFFARPDLVDERNDQYEVGALREVLRIWLAGHPDILRFELGTIGNLDMITPKTGEHDNSKQDPSVIQDSSKATEQNIKVILANRIRS